VNHGCNCTFNIGKPSPFSETSADITDKVVVDFIEESTNTGRGYVYNPAIARDWTKKLQQMNHRPIMKGGELLDNYLSFVMDKEVFAEDMNALKLECAGVALGVVSKYEHSHQHHTGGELDKILIQNETVCLDAMECSSTSHLHSTLPAKRGD
jgi:hypothetical protein